MSVLIIKLGASGDVLRTTPILSLFPDEHVTWITSEENLPLLTLSETLTPVAWMNRDILGTSRFNLAINLEDDSGVSVFLQSLHVDQIFGAHLDGESFTYTPDSNPWFDMSLISRLGRQSADHLKWINRGSYQEILFSCLGRKFHGQPYLMPDFRARSFKGDVAICPTAGHGWPMKGWSGYKEVKRHLEDIGLSVNLLPRRNSLSHHLADVRGHKFLLSGDSLPMHIAIGYQIPTVTLFTCTSPWEIYDYGLQTKIVSSRLSEFFYSRSAYVECPDAIDIDDVVEAVTSRLPAPQLHAL